MPNEAYFNMNFDVHFLLLINHRFFSESIKSLQMVIAAMKLKDAYSLEGKL